ncbi:hypothetical protein INR77_14775 [Erythrobacter sp. SCSIO 43205]|uniref:hypothetical protein n=1 Tax=Erythrobacter sp. SCSIO 43205 TaxID=2779361 RepID=UPI001CA7BF1F|nr:hypothetical protein [Erythrobacter sp. SCSIO 43205]UAB78007.1 hypothetical protein INR77_14775 [Erythrobacter sp. SCSIO 43205]
MIETFFASFFASGHAADLVLAVLALEAVWLKTRGWALATIIGLVGPAVFIVLALRAALVGAGWEWVAVLLALSLPLHLMDLRARL